MAELRTKKQNTVLIVKDWRFWYKIIIGLILVAALAYDWINGMVNMDTKFALNPASAMKDGVITNQSKYDEAMAWGNTWGVGNGKYDYFGFTIFYFTYFTTQSNLFCIFWLFFAARHHLVEGNKSLTKTLVSISVATYITITGIVYNFMLFPLGFIPNPDGSLPISSWSAAQWLSQESLHTLGPITFILYVALFRSTGTQLIAHKKLMRTKWWVPFMYPIVWGIGELVRGEFYFQSGRPESSQYHYFFVDIHSKVSVAGLPGVVWFFIAITFIFCLSFGFFTLYNNSIFNRNLRKALGTEEFKKFKTDIKIDTKSFQLSSKEERINFDAKAKSLKLESGSRDVEKQTAFNKSMHDKKIAFYDDLENRYQKAFSNLK